MITFASTELLHGCDDSLNHIDSSNIRSARTSMRSPYSIQSLQKYLGAVVLIFLHGPYRGVEAFTTFSHSQVFISNVMCVEQRLNRSISILQARPRSEPVAVVQPRIKSSELRRQEAISAMEQSKVEMALTGVDPQMLAILSKQFQLSTEAERQRPKGRPKCVPGAMTQETMQRFRESQLVADQVKHSTENQISSAEIDAIVPYINGNGNIDSDQRIEKIKGIKAKAKAVHDEIPVIYSIPPDASATLKKRRRIVKQLPKIRKYLKGVEGQEEDNRRLKKRPSKNQASGMDINKYYRTELLSPDEEYSLGMKIQFMSQCDDVHEGLASSLGRLPEIEEWAAACGFTDEDPYFVATEADEQLRPPGSDTMFEALEPYMFVGNGLAENSGPGRGRGRVKTVPPLRLKDFYDDSQYRSDITKYNRSKSKNDQKPPKRQLQPINRGTPTKFVEMLMTSKDAKQRMVQSNMRLVLSIARKYSNVGVSLQDLVQEGSLGLSRAAEKFEPRKGFKFSTYASWWIQQSVFRSIAYHSRTIRLPVHVHNLLNRVRKVRQLLQLELSRAPTNEEVATKLGLTVQKFNKMMSLTKRSISLETPKYLSNPKDLGHEGDDSLGDTISASSVLLDESSPEKRVDHSLFHEDLADMMKILDEDERRVICARYGLHDGLTRTVTSVATQMKQSKAWVRSQECRALRKLRRPWYEKKLKDHQEALSN